MTQKKKSGRNTLVILLIVFILAAVVVFLVRVRAKMAARVEESILEDIRRTKEISLHGLTLETPEDWETVSYTKTEYRSARQSGTGNGILCSTAIEYLGEEDPTLDMIQTREYAGQNVKIREDGKLKEELGEGTYRIVTSQGDGNIGFTEYMAIVRADRSYFRVGYKVQSEYYTGEAADAILQQLHLGTFETDAVRSIYAEYEGDLSPGVTIGSDSEGLRVVAVRDDGSEVDITGEAELAEPVTLEPDGSYIMLFDYSAYESHYHCELPVRCSVTTESLRASYSGDTVRGTRIGLSEGNVAVEAVYSDGSAADVTDKCIMEEPDPAVLEPGETAEMVFTYKRKGTVYSCELEVACTTGLTGIRAVYEGDASAGVLIDTGAEGLTVTAQYDDGSEEDVSDRIRVKNPSELKAGKTSEYEIIYRGVSCALEVECTTDPGDTEEVSETPEVQDTPAEEEETASEDPESSEDDGEMMPELDPESGIEL